MNGVRKDKIPFEDALLTALDVKNELTPFCTRIEIGGSIRRKRSEVSDIELIVIPKTTSIPADLFRLKEVRVPGFIKAIEKYPKIIGDPENGKHTIRVHPAGIKLDIFICSRDNWGWILMLRTGPAQYNKWLVSRGGLKKHGYTSVEGQIVRMSDNVIIPTYEEEDVYKLMKMPYVRPEHRAGYEL